MLFFSKTPKKLNSSKPYQIDLESLNGINSIPVPLPESVEGGNMLYYRLQRKATEYKRAGEIDLAIACLWKSIQLSDYAYKQTGRALLMKDDYFRVVKYIHLKGDPEEEERASDYINKCHPEFSDKRISNKKIVDETLKKCAEYRTDLVFLTTNSYCPICSKYDRKVFSITGQTKGYSVLPQAFIKYGGFCKDCSISIMPKFVFNKR